MPRGSQHPHRMLAWAKSFWRGAKAAPTDLRAYWAAMGAAVLLGVFLRLNGYLGHHISLWLDEALWAPRFVRWPLLDLGIRPIGFVWLTRTIVGVFGATEVWFRFLPNVGAIGSLLLMPYVASRVLSSRVLRVLLVLLFAIHPALVDFANEFKPYSFEVLVHLAPIALYLRFEQTQQTRYLYLLLGYLPLSFLLAYNMAFAFPGLLLLALRAGWRAQERRRRLVAAAIVSGALCAALGAGVYALALRAVTTENRAENYWGKKYDVFYRPNEHQSYVDWTLSKYADMAALIGMRRQLWDAQGKMRPRVAAELGSVDRWLWVALYLAGVAALARKQPPRLALFVAPLAVLVLLNAGGKWPLGAFRTNLFASAYLFPVPLMGLELLAGGKRRREWAGIAAVAVTCLIPGFRFGFDWHGHKRTWTRDHYQREVLDTLFRLRTEQLRARPDAQRARLVLDLHTHESHDYYLKVHPTYRAKYAQFFRDNFEVDEVGSNALVRKVQRRLREREPVWVVASKESAGDELLEFAKKKAKVLQEVNVRGQHLILLVD